MANVVTQYLKDTRSELNHVAWPTQTQTIVYTVLVAAISLGIAAYLGLFDFLFTTGLTKVITAGANSSGVPPTTQPASSPATAASTSGQVDLGIPGVEIKPNAPAKTAPKSSK